MGVPEAQPDLERQVARIGHQIAELGHGEKPRMFRMGWWTDRVLAWAMSRPGFKTQLFRFVDVFPACRDDADVMRHLDEYFADTAVPASLELGLDVAEHIPFGAQITAGVARRNIARMARTLIAGASPSEALRAIRRMWESGEASTVDLLGEKTVTAAEADDYARRVLDMLNALAADASGWPERERLEHDPWGRVPRVNVSLKPTALSPLMAPLTCELGLDDAMTRLRPILDAAAAVGATVHLDTESYEVKDLCLELARRAGSGFATGPQLGVVVQAYLRDSLDDLRSLIEWSEDALHVPLQIRLVKGAYWDYETVVARAHGWPVPVWETKAQTDANYERCTRALLDAAGKVRPAFGSHNIRSLAYAIAAARGRGLSDDSYEIQLLYGMAEPVHAALTKMGMRVRAYTPVGKLVPGMSYLVRRLLENTSNESFLRHHFAQGESLDELLAPPRPAAAEPHVDRGREFANEPHLEWRRPDARDRMRRAVESAWLRLEAPLIIDGRRIKTPQTILSVDPGRPSVPVCVSADAAHEHADLAVAAAVRALREWSRTPATARAQVLRRAAALIRLRRTELAALEVFECGKPWAEADADVAEAIDFCEFYAREAETLDARFRAAQAPGERNAGRYRPRGVAAVIAPWNFPLAIPCGMVSAALATGNCVVFKPAEQAPGTGLRLAETFYEAGLPLGALSFLPGTGEIAGAHLVTHPDVSTVAFTGSKSVGLHILAAASEIAPGQRFVRRVVAEMGGKNAIIVDDDADLDVAVPAIVQSAFGYAGQKCSAASRVVALTGIYDELAQRLVGAARVVPVGQACEMATVCGPLIDADAAERVRRYQRDAPSQGDVLLQRDDIESAGYFAGPTIVAVSSPSVPIARDEIFGPVLALMPAAGFDEAIAVANDTEYALTAGLFSRSPVNIERAASGLRAGNIYVNRAVTGALVGRQPFGGFGLSGVGTKAGGADYLLQFVDPVVVTENTIRQGFAPPDL